MNTLKPAGRNDLHQMDYSTITDQLFLGSDLCKMGVCLIHGEEFKKLGITYEVNLSFENNELPPHDILGYLWLPVVDGHAPSLAQIDSGVAFIAAAISDNQKVYVHCRNGHGRGPTLAAAYLMKEHGLSPEKAEEEIQGNRSEVHLEETQKKRLQEYFQHLHI